METEAQSRHATTIQAREAGAREVLRRFILGLIRHIALNELAAGIDTDP
jgi:hypothetical protein